MYRNKLIHQTNK